MKKKVIYLAITSGCSACALMEHIWKEVLSNRKNVELVVSHFEDLPTYIRTNVLITDFLSLLLQKMIELGIILKVLSLNFILKQYSKI